MYNCEVHLVKSCAPCLSEKLIPYTRTEEAIQVSAAKDAMSKLMLSFGGDRFGLEVPRETKASLVQASTDLSKAQVAAQLKAFLMHQEVVQHRAGDYIYSSNVPLGVLY